MAIDAFLHFRLRLLGFRALSAFAATTLIGDFGAGGAGDVVEDCGLEATPEPGHTALLWWVSKGLMTRKKPRSWVYGITSSAREYASWSMWASIPYKRRA